MTSIPGMENGPRPTSAARPLRGGGGFVARWWPLIWGASILVPASRKAASGRPRDIALAVLMVAAAGAFGFASSRGPLRSRQGLPTADRTALVACLLGAACTVPCVWAFGIEASALVFFALVALALTVDIAPAMVMTALFAGGMWLADGRPGWGQTSGLTVGLLATGIGAALGRRASIRTREAKLANEYAHQMEINDERNRMARDLHDILGHSLTVITLKTELAGKLLDLDPAAAREQLAEVQSLSRSALADVRATVNNYRELSLAAELARASTTLAAAGVKAELPATIDVVPPELRELFAWVVREGTTNVVRHASASHCRVGFTPVSVSVVDDGQGVQGPSDGHGIQGLRERCAASGVEVQLRPGPHGAGTELVATAREVALPLSEDGNRMPSSGGGA